MIRALCYSIKTRHKTVCVISTTFFLPQVLTRIKPEKDQKTIFDWLNAPNAETNLILARSKRCASTGEWILNDPKYKQWFDTPHGLLWVSGIRKYSKIFAGYATVV
jgi:hypothetical protein